MSSRNALVACLISQLVLFVEVSPEGMVRVSALTIGEQRRCGNTRDGVEEDARESSGRRRSRVYGDARRVHAGQGGREARVKTAGK